MRPRDESSEQLVVTLLAGHDYEPIDVDVWRCTCGWAAKDEGWDPGAHRAHQAAVLAQAGLLADLDTIQTLSGAYRKAIGVPESEHQRRRMESLAQELEAARAELTRLREVMTPEQEALDGAGITWQSRARRLAARLADAEQRGAVAALKRVTEEWRYGGWTVLNAPVSPPAVPAIARGQIVTDWLHERLTRLTEGGDRG